MWEAEGGRGLKKQTRHNNEKSKFLAAHMHTPTYEHMHICPTNEAECQTGMHTFVVSKDLHECWRRHTRAWNTKRMRTHGVRRTFPIYAGFLLLLACSFFFFVFCLKSTAHFLTSFSKLLPQLFFIARVPVRLVTLLQFITLTFYHPTWRRRRISNAASIKGLIKNANLLEKR